MDKQDSVWTMVCVRNVVGEFGWCDSADDRADGAFDRLTPIRHCRVHKVRNITERLAKSLRVSIH